MGSVQFAAAKTRALDIFRREIGKGRGKSSQE
jgi:hypothetical protein